MKIRQGFVSNSSSSSFCIYGVQLDMRDVIKYMPEGIDVGLSDNEIVEEMYNKGGDWWSVAEKISKALGNGFSCYYDYECPEIYAGRSLTSIGDEETGLQFKMVTEARIQEVIDENYECRFIEETVQC